MIYYLLLLLPYFALGISFPGATAKWGQHEPNTLESKVRDGLTYEPALWLAQGRPKGIYPYSANISYHIAHSIPHKHKLKVYPSYKYDLSKVNVTHCNVAHVRVLNGSDMTFEKCTGTLCLLSCLNASQIHDIADNVHVLSLELNPSAMQHIQSSNVAISAQEDQVGNRFEVLTGTGFPLLTGSGLTAYVVDTGLDTLHRMFYWAVGSFPIQDFSVQSVPSASHPKVRAYFHDGNGKSVARGSHGTAVASCAVGYNNDMGVSGIATEAKISFMDVSSNGNTLNGFVLNSVFIKDILQRGLDSGAKLMIHSYGDCTGTASYSDFSVEFDEFTWENPHVVNVVSAGNYQPSQTCGSTRNVGNPATAKNVISVGASFSTYAGSPPLFNTRSVADFSSIGPTRDGRVSPMFYAPGVRESVAFGLSTDTPDHQTMGSASGTSFSAPLLGGLVILIQQWYLQTYSQEIYASAVNAVLLARSTSMLNLVNINTGQSIPNSDQFGYGFPTIGNPNELSIVNGQLIDEGARWSECTKDPSAIALSWTDRPAASYASKTLVNDFELFVFDLQGNRLNSHDSTNPHELFRTTTPGNYRIVVIARDLFSSSDRFSLAYDGTNEPACAGSCLPGEVISCDSGRGYQVCDTSTGDMGTVCHPHRCSPGYGGMKCADPDVSQRTSTLGTPCLIDDGEGELDMLNYCVAVSCSNDFNVISEDSTCSCIYSNTRYYENGDSTAGTCSNKILSAQPSTPPTARVSRASANCVILSWWSYFLIYMVFLFML